MLDPRQDPPGRTPAAPQPAPPVEVEQRFALDELGRIRTSTTPVSIFDDGTLAEQSLGEELSKDGKEILVPESTADETASNTPTYSKPLVRVRIPAGVPGEVFRNCLSAAYHGYLRHGKVSAEDIQEATLYPIGKVSQVINSAEFKYALTVRGIPSNGYTGLTAEMDHFLLILLDPTDNLTMGQKLKKGGVTNTKYRAWMKNPAFARQVNAASESLIASSHEALVQLSGLVGKGNLPAIKYQLEMNNRYNPAKEQALDAAQFAAALTEVVMRVVKDPVMLQEIADGMAGVAERSMKTIQS